VTNANKYLDPLDTRKMDGKMFSNVNRMPFEVVGAHNSTLHTTEGELLDFWGDEGVQSLGYNSVPLREAVLSFFDHAQPHQLPDIYPNSVRFRAAERLTAATGMDRVFFANSGAEVNEGMIKLARRYWHLKGQENRKMILTIKGNFHGRTGFAMAAADPRVSPHHREGMGDMPKGFGVLSDDCEFSLEVLDGEELPIPIPREEIDWSEIAAITMAPILGNNCVMTYDREFWEGLEALRTEHGVLIMYDDVQAGFGRAGYIASYQNPDIGVKPDIMCIAKGMAMGFPMSTLYAREDVALAFTPGSHFNTFGGSPFVCWMAMKMLDWLEVNLEGARLKGEFIRAWFDGAEWIREHDGSGLLNAFTPDFERHGYNGYEFVHKARSFGLSLATHRPLGAIRFTPPMNVTARDVEKAFTILDQTHEALMSEKENAS